MFSAYSIRSILIKDTLKLELAQKYTNQFINYLEDEEHHKLFKYSAEIAAQQTAEKQNKIFIIIKSHLNSQKFEIRITAIELLFCYFKKHLDENDQIKIWNGLTEVMNNSVISISSQNPDEQDEMEFEIILNLLQAIVPNLNDDLQKKAIHLFLKWIDATNNMIINAGSYSLIDILPRLNLKEQRVDVINDLNQMSFSLSSDFLETILHSNLADSVKLMAPLLKRIITQSREANEIFGKDLLCSLLEFPFADENTATISAITTKQVYEKSEFNFFKDNLGENTSESCNDKKCNRT